MGKILSFCIVTMMALTGCSAGQEKIQTYLENPGKLLEDPHFAEYQKNLDALESRYLAKEITYAEYLEQKKGLDEKYTKEVKDREEIISPSPQPQLNNNPQDIP